MNDEEEYKAPEPTPEVLSALRTVLASEWFFDELENANYHSAFQFLEELKQELEDKFV
jgi:hypothetical protein